MERKPITALAGYQFKKTNNKTIPSFNHSVRTRSRMQKVCTKATSCNISAKCSALLINLHYKIATIISPFSLKYTSINLAYIKIVYC